MDELSMLTRQVLDACTKIHTSIGPGCYEKLYDEALHFELHQRKMNVQRQVLLPIQYEL